MWSYQANDDTGAGHFEISDGDRTFVAMNEPAAIWLTQALNLRPGHIADKSPRTPHETAALLRDHLIQARLGFDSITPAAANRDLTRLDLKAASELAARLEYDLRQQTSAIDTGIESASDTAEEVKRLESENVRLAKRINELLVAIRRISAETPYPEEANSAATLIAEVGTLRSQLRELLFEKDATSVSPPPSRFLINSNQLEGVYMEENGMRDLMALCLGPVPGIRFSMQGCVVVPSKSNPAMFSMRVAKDGLVEVMICDAFISDGSDVRDRAGVEQEHVVDVCHAFGWRHDFAASGPLTWEEILPQIRSIGETLRHADKVANEERRHAAAVGNAVGLLKFKARREAEAAAAVAAKAKSDPFVSSILGHALGGFLAGIVNKGVEGAEVKIEASKAAAAELPDVETCGRCSLENYETYCRKNLTCVRTGKRCERTDGKSSPSVDDPSKIERCTFGGGKVVVDRAALDDLEHRAKASGQQLDDASAVAIVRESTRGMLAMSMRHEEKLETLRRNLAGQALIEMIRNSKVPGTMNEVPLDAEVKAIAASTYATRLATHLALTQPRFEEDLATIGKRVVEAEATRSVAPLDETPSKQRVAYPPVPEQIKDQRAPIFGEGTGVGWDTDTDASPPFSGTRAIPCHSRLVGGVLCRWWGDGPTPAGVALIDAAVRTPEVMTIDARRRTDAIHALRVDGAGWLGEVSRIIVDALDRAQSDRVGVDAWAAMLVEIADVRMAWKSDPAHFVIGIERAINAAFGELVTSSQLTWDTMIDRIEDVFEKSREV